MKRIGEHLKSKNGFAFIISILIILGIGILGLALASGTVSNLRLQKSIQRMEHNYYGADGAMSHVLAVLERACSYGRRNAAMAADEAYISQFENNDIRLSNDELLSIYITAFKQYITVGRGKTFISEQLEAMRTNPLFKAKAEPMWEESFVDDEGVKLKVNLTLLLSKEKLNATFNMPLNYDLGSELEIPIIKDIPVGSASMPIGFYNPVFRSPLTMNSGLKLNSNGDLYLDSGSSTGIAVQWSKGLTSGLVYSDARIDIFGTTIPALEREPTYTLLGNSKDLYVNGSKADRTTLCDKSNRISISNYYDPAYMSQIIINKTDGENSYYEAVQGDCILRVYTGDANILGDTARNEWRSLSGKRGLVVIAGNLLVNGNSNISSFNGGIVILGGGTSRLDSSLKIIHNEEAVLQAINLYRKATGSNVFELMFKLNTLMDTTYDPEAKIIRTVTGGKLLDSPLIIGNSYITASGLRVDEQYPYFRIANKKFYILDTAKGLQASMPTVNVVMHGSSFYKNNTVVWNETSSGLRTTESIGDIYNFIDADLMKSWIDSGITRIYREKAAGSNYYLIIYTGDATINNNGKIGDDTISGRRGLLFINGRLTIEGPFNYNGVVIAANGINAYEGGNVQINFDPEVALEALNTTTSAIDFFAKGAIVEEQTVSVYDNVLPSARVSNDALTLFSSAVTLSNVKFLSPFTNSTILGAYSEIDLNNADVKITSSPAGKGLQTTTNNIYVSMAKYTQNSFASDALTTNATGAYGSVNTVGYIEDLINVSELTNWLGGTGAPIEKTSGDLALALYTEGQELNMSLLNGKKGFVFYNGKLNITSDFTFQGVVIATHGISVQNCDVNITFDQTSAVDAVSLDTTATKIFLNVPESSVTPGTTYVGASSSGNVNTGNAGVTIVSWHSVK